MENEKRERLSQLLKEVLTETPETRAEILEEIDNITIVDAVVAREIERWAKNTK